MISMGRNDDDYEVELIFGIMTLDWVQDMTSRRSRVHEHALTDPCVPPHLTRSFGQCTLKTWRWRYR
jgi:hypothetical protein